MSATADLKKRPIAASICGAIALITGYLFFWPVPFDPAPDKALQPSPAGQGVFAKNNKMAEAEIIKTGHGPESIAIDKSGRLYTGLEDGRIIRIENGVSETLANTAGRPIGVEFDARGNLIIADIHKGLLSMAADGSLSVLVDSYQGEKMIFVDDLAIADDGKIYFSDASTHFTIGMEILEAFERRPSGRLFVYDPADGSTELLMDNLHFANGVALAADEAFVLVNETFSHRIQRYWLAGPRRGESELFAQNLPGFIDNITEAPGGGFWLAIVNPRSPQLDALVPSPFMRKLVWRLLTLSGNSPALHHSWAVKLSEDGVPLVSYEDDSEHIFNMTSVIEHEGKLYLGSLTEPQIGILPAP